MFKVGFVEQEASPLLDMIQSVMLGGCFHPKALRILLGYRYQKSIN